MESGTSPKKSIIGQRRRPSIHQKKACRGEMQQGPSKYEMKKNAKNSKKYILQSEKNSSEEVIFF